MAAELAPGVQERLRGHPTDVPVSFPAAAQAAVGLLGQLAVLSEPFRLVTMQREHDLSQVTALSPPEAEAVTPALL